MPRSYNTFRSSRIVKSGDPALPSALAGLLNPAARSWYPRFWSPGEGEAFLASPSISQVFEDFELALSSQAQRGMPRPYNVHAS